MFELNQLYNIDCMTAMREIPDKFFELAICDPPYGIGIDGQKLNINKKNPKHTRKEHTRKNWDDAIPPEEYFRELERISVNQILWGGNYFVEHLTRGTKGWIVWDKGQHGLTMSDCEFEIDADYFSKAAERIRAEQAQITIFDFIGGYERRRGK